MFSWTYNNNTIKAAKQYAQLIQNANDYILLDIITIYLAGNHKQTVFITTTGFMYKLTFNTVWNEVALSIQTFSPQNY